MDEIVKANGGQDNAGAEFSEERFAVFFKPGYHTLNV